MKKTRVRIGATPTAATGAVVDMCEYCLLTWPWLQRSGWSVQKPEVEDGTDGYLGKDGKGNDGPYKDLGINRRNGLYIEADQDKDFDNCHGKNNVSKPSSLCRSHSTLILLSHPARLIRRVLELIQRPWEDNCRPP